jgi:hypothetical protein
MSEVTFSFFVDFDDILGSQTASQRTHRYVDLAKAEHIRLISQLHHSVPLPRYSVSVKAAPIHINHVRVSKPVSLAYVKPVSLARGRPYLPRIPNDEKRRNER